MKYLKTREDAIVPTKGSAAAAGYDLYVPKNQEDIIIAPITESISTIEAFGCSAIYALNAA